FVFFFFFSSRRRHTRSDRDWSSDVCSSDLTVPATCTFLRIIATPIFDNLFAEGDPNLRRKWRSSGRSLTASDVPASGDYRPPLHNVRPTSRQPRRCEEQPTSAPPLNSSAGRILGH